MPRFAWSVATTKDELSKLLFYYTCSRPIAGEALCWAIQIIMKWNGWGFRPHMRTYRLSCARRTSWGWRDEWDDTALQIQDSKFEPWQSEVEHATSRWRRLSTILGLRVYGKFFFCFLETAETRNRAKNSSVEGSGVNHYPRVPPIYIIIDAD